MIWGMPPKYDLEEQVVLAGNYYLKKYGVLPSIVWLNTANFGILPEMFGTIKVEYKSHLLRRDLWIGDLSGGNDAG